MKKSLLLLLLPALLIVSCSKKSDNQPDNSTSAKLTGTWSETSSKRIYYNASNVKVFEENEDLGVLSFDGKSTVTATYGATQDKGTYSITKDNNIEYLTLSGGGGTLKYSILSMSDTNMSISFETLNDTYFEGGKIKTAAKSVLTTTLVKK